MVMLSGCTHTPIKVESKYALGETYQSPLGFSIYIPPHWWIMSGEKIKENRDLADFVKEVFKKIDSKRIKNDLVQGETEFYFNKKTSDYYGLDRIHVFKEIVPIPQNNSVMKKFCNILASKLAKKSGKPVKVYSCELRTISGLNASYFEYDGISENTRGITYGIQFTEDETIFFTLTCKNRIVDEMRKEFDDIIASIKIEK